MDIEQKTKYNYRATVSQDSLTEEWDVKGNLTDDPIPPMLQPGYTYTDRTDYEYADNQDNTIHVRKVTTYERSDQYGDAQMPDPGTDGAGEQATYQDTLTWQWGEDGIEDYAPYAQMFDDIKTGTTAVKADWEAYITGKLTFQESGQKWLHPQPPAETHGILATPRVAQVLPLWEAYKIDRDANKAVRTCLPVVSVEVQLQIKQSGDTRGLYAAVYPDWVKAAAKDAGKWAPVAADHPKGIVQYGDVVKDLDYTFKWMGGNITRNSTIPEVITKLIQLPPAQPGDEPQLEKQVETVYTYQITKQWMAVPKADSKRNIDITSAT